MPHYRLRSWSEQTLYDCHDYMVDTNSIEEAAALLRQDQRYADEQGQSVGSSPGVERLVGGTRETDVRPLDPAKVIDGTSGIAEIDAAGNKIREIAFNAPSGSHERTTTNFTVRWMIDITADSAREAAEKALAIQRDPYSVATSFEVCPYRTTGFSDRIDHYREIDLWPKHADG